MTFSLTFRPALKIWDGVNINELLLNKTQVPALTLLALVILASACKEMSGGTIL
jgi:hypothetical protein